MIRYDKIYSIEISINVESFGYRNDEECGKS